MNALQEKLFAEPIEPPTAATRPFTRVLNVFCDQIKPAMRKHKVDRSVLDAIVRQLEGFHRSFVVVTIAELAARAGVSNSSVSAALARLEAQGLITRWRKLLKDRSRFVWCLALTEKYRVVEGIGPQTSAPTRFHHPSSAPSCPIPSDSSLEATQDSTPSAALADESTPVVSPEQPTPPAGEASGDAIAGRDWQVPTDLPAQPAASSVEHSPEHKTSAPAQIPAAQSARPELTAEQKDALKGLQAVRIDYWMARKLARTHSPDIIHQALQDLRYHSADVRNPAAWLVRAIERGGYASPRAAEEERLKNERMAREALQRDWEAREAAQAEQASESLLARYHQLDSKRQCELEQLARTELARVSPRLAEAPADVETPGPFRSKLLELLELAPDIAAPVAAVEPPRREQRPTPLDPASGVLLERFRQLEPEQQRELEQRTRNELRRVSPRLADAPWELDSPGPLRSQLLTLIEGFDAGSPTSAQADSS